jgi:Tol biopolymer transport system component
MNRTTYRLCAVLGLLLLLALPAATLRAKQFIGVSSPAWSPDGKYIAFSVRHQEVMALFVVGANRLDPVKLADNGDMADWSPDGSRLAYVEVIGNANTIYTINVDGSSRTRIANGFMPAWSPDGRQIAFVASDILYVANDDGSTPRRLLGDDKLNIWHFGWSPDGSRIAVTMSGPNAMRARTFVVNLDGTDVRTLADGVGGQVSWSPDGRQVAFSGDCGPDRVAGICMVDANHPSGSTLLFRNGEAPRWSPDGSRLAFVLDGGICVTTIDGSNERCLTARYSSDWLESSPWSPDGKQLFVRRAHVPEPMNGERLPYYSEVLVYQTDGSGYYALPDGFETF